MKSRIYCKIIGQGVGDQVGQREEDSSHELVAVEIWVWGGEGPLLSQSVCTFEIFHYKNVFFSLSIPFKITKTIKCIKSNLPRKVPYLRKESAAPAEKPEHLNRHTGRPWLGVFAIRMPSIFALVHL